ncbi:MAG: phosphodiester glycosidase family protein [Oscillochloris sp.]|nr:phosphodiester glycosidase family protein [Oscillochloris sp.]
MPVATLMPTPTGPPPATAVPTSAPADSGWIGAAPGVELRRMRVELGVGLMALVRIVRLDPARVRFQVGYAPDSPRTLTRWVEQSGALAAINGGFFDEQNRTVSLLVLGGQPVGESYSGRGGMFAVAQDGSLQLRGLAEAPYGPNEALAEALQGWPLLVRPGGTLAYTFEDDERARRSALAIDRAGHVLLIASPSTTFTLAELAAWLAGSDLEIDAAVNLDGGSSTALTLSAQGAREHVEAFVPLPIVLLALPR